MHGQTTGWVGVGISPSGGMIGADMFVGWVKDGIASVTVSIGPFCRGVVAVYRGYLENL